MSQLHQPPERTSQPIATELTSVETTTGRLIIYNQSDAKERISSSLTLSVEP